MRDALAIQLLNVASLRYSRLLDDPTASAEQVLMALLVYQLAVATLQA